MPELPEVETMRRGVAAVAGLTIDDVVWPRCRKRPLQVTPSAKSIRRRLAGKQILQVERLGKRVVLLLSNGDALVFEPRMTGLVLLADPPTDEHLRLRLQLSGRSELELLFWDRRGLGQIKLLSAAEWAELQNGERLGPDALAITAAVLRERLCASRRAIKVALLDQRALAGVGNLYASEILHLAGIDPRRPCTRLKPADWARIHACMLEVLQTAIRYEGSTLSDGTYRNALNQAGGYQNHHRVYDRAGETCVTCGRSQIVRIVQAQRSTFYCAVCQRGRPRAK